MEGQEDKCDMKLEGEILGAERHKRNWNRMKGGKTVEKDKSKVFLDK